MVPSLLSDVASKNRAKIHFIMKTIEPSCWHIGIFQYTGWVHVHGVFFSKVATYMDATNQVKLVLKQAIYVRKRTLIVQIGFDYAIIHFKIAIASYAWVLFTLW